MKYEVPQCLILYNRNFHPNLVSADRGSFSPVKMEFVVSLVILYLSLNLAEGGLENVPIGHMKPLGGHTPPSAVEERYDIPSAEEFWEKYAKPMKPVIFRGLNKVSPVFTKWTDEYMKENFGDMEMRIEVKREATEQIPEGDKGLARDTLRNFINTYHGKTTKYVISDLPKPMYKDFLVPPFVGCGSFADRMVEADIWIGGGGSSSRIHKDAFHIINCLFNGTKEWKMIELKHEKNIYKVPEEEGRLSGISFIDPMKVDLKKFPNVQKVPWSFVNVTPGDCLFIPRQMYHQVRSFGTHNLAISLLFSRFVKHQNLNFSDCPASGFRPLTDFDPDWQYEGSGPFPMGRADLEYGVKVELLSMVNKEDNVVLDRLRNGLKVVETSKKHGRSDADVDQLVEQFYAVFGKNVSDIITGSEIKALKKEPLRKIALMLAVSDPYNTIDYEYYHIDALGIVRIMTEIFQSENMLQKKAFIDRYVSDLGGTRRLGEKFFNNLGGNGKDSITKDVALENINETIAQYDEFETKYHVLTTYGEKENVIPSIDYASLLKNPEKIDDVEREERAREVDDQGNLVNAQGGRDDNDEGDSGDTDDADEKDDGSEDEGDSLDTGDEGSEGKGTNGDGSSDAEGEEGADTEADEDGDTEGDEEGDTEGDENGDAEGDEEGDTEGDEDGDTEGNEGGESDEDEGSENDDGDRADDSGDEDDDSELEGSETASEDKSKDNKKDNKQPKDEL